MARLPGVRRAVPRLADVLGARVAVAPAAQPDARTTVRAEVRDAAGDRVSAVELSGPDPYALTADLLAWAAVRAATAGVRDTGALGPVQAFGLAELTAGAAAAGLSRR
jgi:hypothetical protein